MSRLTKEQIDTKAALLLRSIEMYGSGECLDGMGYSLEDMRDLFDTIEALEALEAAQAELKAERDNARDAANGLADQITELKARIAQLDCRQTDELKAQCAAVMEKAVSKVELMVEHRSKCSLHRDKECDCPAADVVNALRALIPADWSAALAERDKSTRLSEQRKFLHGSREALNAYVADRVREAKREERTRLFEILESGENSSFQDVGRYLKKFADKAALRAAEAGRLEVPHALR